jgi:ADP-ribose pyrophosphatase YjhB (NUDIX family)
LLIGEIKMNSDLCVKMEEGILNIRVGAIIMKENKFLMVENDRFDYMYSVGGRIKFGETAEEAVVREVYEETGIKMEIDRLGFIHENFFPGDSLAKKGNIVHEISLFFYMKVPEGFEPVCNSFTEDGNKERLVWITTDYPKKYYPEFFKTELVNRSESVKHFVTRDKNI